MKNAILILLMAITGECLAVCSTPISRTNFSTLEKLTSNRMNTELNTVYTRANELPGDCITDETITSAKIDDGTIVNADISTTAAISASKIATPNNTVSSSSGTFSTNSAVAIDVTNLSAAITTTGKPVEVFLIPDGAGEAFLLASSAINGSAGAAYLLYRDGVEIAKSVVSGGAGGATSFEVKTPPSSVRYIDSSVASGAHTYKIMVYAVGVNDLAGAYYTKLVVREL